MSTPFKKYVVSLGLVAGISCGIGFSILAWGQTLQPAGHQPHPLAGAQALFVEGLAITEDGFQDSSLITNTVIEKLRQAGFAVVLSPDQPHDVVVRVKCEEQKTRTGLNGIRSNSPVPTSRLWEGPACRITYQYQGHSPQWHWEVRTPFQNPSAGVSGNSGRGIWALNALNTQLQQDDFALFLLAEWEQADRLLMLFQKSADNLARQKTILTLLGTVPSDNAFEVLKEALHVPELASAALMALGQQGAKAIPVIVSHLNATTQFDHRLAAIQALSVIATHSNAPDLLPQFIKHLDSDDRQLQTEAVKGLGRLGDRRAIQALEALSLKVWTDPSNSQDMQALREMVSWSIKQLKPNAHTGE